MTRKYRIMDGQRQKRVPRICDKRRPLEGQDGDRQKRGEEEGAAVFVLSLGKAKQRLAAKRGVVL